MYALLFSFYENIFVWPAQAKSDGHVDRLHIYIFISHDNAELSYKDKWYPFKRVIHLSGIHLERFDCIT